MEFFDTLKTWAKFPNKDFLESTSDNGKIWNESLDWFPKSVLQKRKKKLKQFQKFDLYLISGHFKVTLLSLHVVIDS